jgi:hypothetical protein
VRQWILRKLRMFLAMQIELRPGWQAAVYLTHIWFIAGAETGQVASRPFLLLLLKALRRPRQAWIAERWRVEAMCVGKRTNLYERSNRDHLWTTPPRFSLPVA